MPASTRPREAATTARERALEDGASVESVVGEVARPCDFSDALILRTSEFENDKLVCWLLGADVVPGSQALHGSAVEARACATSINVFKRHLIPAKRQDEVVARDSIISRECYEDWLSTRSHVPAEPEKTFQRILACTVSGTDGHQPFSPEEEASVLKQLRIKRVWPAFTDTGLAIGTKGFRGCAFSSHHLTRRTDSAACTHPASGSTRKRVCVEKRTAPFQASICCSRVTRRRRPRRLLLRQAWATTTSTWSRTWTAIGLAMRLGARSVSGSDESVVKRDRYFLRSRMTMKPTPLADGKNLGARDFPRPMPETLKFNRYYLRARLAGTMRCHSSRNDSALISVRPVRLRGQEDATAARLC